MEIELKTDWQDTQVEFLKSLYGFEIDNVDENVEVARVNKEIGILDYVTENGDDEKILLRVIVDPGFNAEKAYMDITKKTLEDVENDGFDEAIIVANRFTKASKRLLRKNEDFEYISSSNRNYSFFELIEGIKNLTHELCETECGEFPTREEDCEGYQDGRYTCKVRRISDDTDFHMEMKWLELLMNDFSRLVDLQRELKE
jgi:hypothetical protein